MVAVLNPVGVTHLSGPMSNDHRWQARSPRSAQLVRAAQSLAGIATLDEMQRLLPGLTVRVFDGCDAALFAVGAHDRATQLARAGAGVPGEVALETFRSGEALEPEIRIRTGGGSTSVTMALRSPRRLHLLAVRGEAERGSTLRDDAETLVLFAALLNATWGRAAASARETPSTSPQIGSATRFTFDDLVGTDPGFAFCVESARRVARVDSPVLITGESGTGKELFAQAIHSGSPRAQGPFVAVNVAAIPRELLESELFGYEKGAFTGAREGGKAGRFEQAAGGTILLDEIGDMPLELQAKLLRVLQERTVQRLGGAHEVPLRARVIATTHRNLDDAVKAGTFRLDLLYRLRVVHLKLPPLRQRKGDVRALVEHAIARICAQLGRRPVGVAAPVMVELERYDWPGNVRELTNVLEGELCLLDPEDDVLARVPAAIGGMTRVVSGLRSAASALSASTDEVLPFDVQERRIIEHALERFDGSVARAARALGLSRGTLYNKLRAWEPPQPRVAAAIPLTH